MILNLSSLAILALATAYLLLNLNKRRMQLSEAFGLTALHALAFVSAAAFGVVAVQAFEYRLYPALAAALIFACLVGAAGGRAFGRPAAVRAALNGCLGAIAAVAGGMTIFANGQVTFAADIVAILLLFLLQKAIDWRAGKGAAGAKGKKASGPAAKPSTAPTMLYAAVVIAAAAALLLGQDRIAVGQFGQPQLQQAVLDEDNNLQSATIELGATGFSPKNSEFATGAMAKVVIRVDRASDAGRKLICKSLDIEAPLKQGDNSFLLNHPQPGIYAFELDGGGYRGTFTVK
ncbi:hypothetical protein [Cohnella nanjingensis]|uniref:EfeO-type cupredoxin-like domain-containing protein n=1 Tax=Cohnella nanjingensis TaxID=1387779 RepID=A0A7X0VDD8_9BACL|nr:hypothetical protein [Cohnella nanjingensis]MBB6669113.1 hypothetical protein [Cohnella nanjingensis]